MNFVLSLNFDINTSRRFFGRCCLMYLFATTLWWSLLISCLILGHLGTVVVLHLHLTMELNLHADWVRLMLIHLWLSVAHYFSIGYLRNIPFESFLLSSAWSPEFSSSRVAPSFGSSAACLLLFGETNWTFCSLVENYFLCCSRFATGLVVHLLSLYLGCRTAVWNIDFHSRLKLIHYCIQKSDFRV